jgi:hypothetical protein
MEFWIFLFFVILFLETKLFYVDMILHNFNSQKINKNVLFKDQSLLVG